MHRAAADLGESGPGEEVATSVQISLFGGISAATDDGAVVDVGPAKCQAVLAVLALSPGALVPVSRIIELVWGDKPPRTAHKTLQSYITRLRKALGDDSIARVGAAYRLEVAPESVDVVRFQRALAGGDATAALAEWAGPPLAGLGASGLDAAVGGLVEQYLGAVESDLEQRVEADASVAIGPLTELTATYPFREGLWALLMTALYRVGRQADALAAYRRARTHLVDELGVEPGPRLRELEARVLGHDELLTVDRGRGAGSRPSGTVTFGFTELDEAVWSWPGPGRQTAAVIARHDDIVTAAVDRHGGHVFATGGDSFGAAFHRASDGCAWAMDVQAAVAAEPWPDGAGVGVRIGLHTGETEERGRGYFGPAVIVAAQLAGAAHGGQILLSAATAGLLEDAETRDLGTFRLDGVMAEQRVVQLGSGRFPPLRIAPSAHGDLPRRLGRVFGRERELDELLAALPTAPVLTLVGPGGIGKTRLAVEAAHRTDVARDRRLVELAAVDDPDGVPRAVASALDVAERPGRTWTESIVAALSSRRVLVVLDNCEHVVEGAAALVRALSAGCPDVRVLATSREGLGVADERLIAVAPLDPEGAGVDLFVERALAVSASLDPVRNRPEIEEICRRLDGVPLAIELAAARTRSLSPSDLVERLDDRLRLLTGGRRVSVERHRTLRATIQWSYDLLSDGEQTLFRRLSIFAGPFDLGAAEAVAADDSLDRIDVDELLAGLVDRSMVTVESSPFGRRFRLLETMRQFGAEQLSEVGRTDRAARRHLAWCRDSIAAIRPLLAGTGEIEGVARLDELWPNLRAAVGYAIAVGDGAAAFSLIEPIMPESYLRARGELGEWCEQILAIDPPADEETSLWCLLWAARRYMRLVDRSGYEALVARWGEPDHPMMRYARAFIWGDVETMVVTAPEVAALLRDRGDGYVADMFSVTALAIALVLGGRLDEADEWLGEAVERFRTDGPPTALQYALTWLGAAASIREQHEEAQAFYAAAAEVDTPPGTHTLKNPLEAERALRQGDARRAFELFADYLQELIDQDNTYIAKTSAVIFAGMMGDTDRLGEAAAILGFLEASGSMALPAWRRSLANVRRRVDATALPRDRIAVIPDDRAALIYMRDVAAGIADGHRAVDAVTR